MIGIGLVKDSEAVFFQYVGEDRAPQALMMPSGKPVTRMQSVSLTGVSIAEDIGEFKSTKLNLFFNTGSNTIMLTSGLKTIWSQCMLTGLIEVLNKGDLSQPLVLESWKGTSMMKPCFAAIRQGNTKYSNQEMYETLGEARRTKNEGTQMLILRDAVSVLSAYLGVEETEGVVENNTAD